MSPEYPHHLTREIMNTPTTNGIRIIISWLVGIITWVASIRLLTPQNNELTKAAWLMPHMVIGIMIAIRVGRIVYFRNSNAGFSPRTNSRYWRWIVVLIILGIADHLFLLAYDLLIWGGDIPKSEKIFPFFIWLGPTIIVFSTMDGAKYDGWLGRAVWIIQTIVKKWDLLASDPKEK